MDNIIAFRFIEYNIRRLKTTEIVRSELQQSLI